MVIGILSRLMQLNRKSSSTGIFILNVIHKYLGYSLLILCKIQIYIKLEVINKGVMVVALITADAILLALLVVRKVVWPTMSEKNMSHNYDYAIVPEVKSL
jgi:hypothetical protein